MAPAAAMAPLSPRAVPGSSSTPSQLLPHPGSLLCKSLCSGAAGVWKGCTGVSELRGCRAGGSWPCPHPRLCPVPPAPLCQMHPSTVRAAQSQLPPLPPRLFCNHSRVPLGDGGWWRGRGDRDRGEDGGWCSLPGPVGCIPTELGAKLRGSSRTQHAGHCSRGQ